MELDGWERGSTWLMSADEPDDAATIAASLVDPERFGAIVDTHGPAVTAYLARRVGLVLAQDLASEPS
jgi:hypothetical protein